ncbi:dicarboxylic amino acid permease, partial [Ascoidea rubescens DSM 1968]
PPLANEVGHRLVKTLCAYQIMMILLGSALGTGLTISSASQLQKSGPGSLFIAYILVATLIYFVVGALCEMSSYIPLPDGFVGYAGRYVDPALGFATGYAFLFRFLTAIPNQITAGALVIQYWVPRDQVNPGVWVTIFAVLIGFINYINISKFAVVETVLSSFKIITVLGLILMLFCITLGAGPEADGPIGFRYWKNPGAFAPYDSLHLDNDGGKFLSWITTLTGSVYAFMGIENFAIIVCEISNPRKTIPKAFKLTFTTVASLYITSVFLLGLCVAYNDAVLVEAVSNSSGNAGASAFVVAIENAGIPILDHIFNACMLVFVFSAANTALYFGTRVLYGLSVSGNAVRIFSKTNRHGVPVYSLCFFLIFDCLAYMNVAEESRKIFRHFINVSSMLGLMGWTSIFISHIRFVKAFKAQGLDRKADLKYKLPLAPYSSYIGLGVSIVLSLLKNLNVFLDINTSGFSYENFISGYIGIPLFVGCYLGYKIYFKTEFIRSDYVDLFFYKDYVDAEEEAF